MALAEARAAWQRTANRCLVQEDAKRAPKLACCSSSVPPSAKQPDTEPASATDGLDIPNTGAKAFNRNPSYSNLSPNSRWWLQLQPNYGYPKNFMDDQLKGKAGTCEMQESLDDSGVTDQTSYFESSFSSQEGVEKVKDGKKSNELYFDLESSWIGAEKGSPWWRTADTEELALLVSQSSLDLIENCDLPNPQNNRVKKHPDVNIFSPLSKPSFGTDRHLFAHAYKHRVAAEPECVSGAVKPLSYPKTRDSLAQERTRSEMHALQDDASKSQLLEALCHSQTRAREAEKVAKQACEEKEHVVKLVFRQASQLFAYRQWLHILQLENMYSQLKYSNKNESVSTIFPVVLPWTPHRTRKMRKTWQKSTSRKRGKRARPKCDVGRYAIAFALGLGLVGAGLLLGWTIGWMLPTW